MIFRFQALWRTARTPIFFYFLPAAMRRARWLPMLSSRATMRCGALTAKVATRAEAAWLPLLALQALCSALYRLPCALARWPPMIFPATMRCGALVDDIITC